MTSRKLQVASFVGLIGLVVLLILLGFGRSAEDARATDLIVGRWKLVSADGVKWSEVGTPDLIEFNSEEVWFPVPLTFNGTNHEYSRAFGKYEIRNGWLLTTLHKKFGVIGMVGQDGKVPQYPPPPPPVHLTLKVNVTDDELTFSDDQGNSQRFTRVADSR